MKKFKKDVAKSLSKVAMQPVKMFHPPWGG